jgi:alkanesulfonate monooxygenase SsuD/methylene tetrahydromethanopterin reductase-like flavin-dependent oxidoreductase (luciferase family)
MKFGLFYQLPCAATQQAETRYQETIEHLETMALYGSPETCIRKIKEIQEQCQMDQLICWFNPGGLVPHTQVLTSMRRFVHEVMPAVRFLSV